MKNYSKYYLLSFILISFSASSIQAQEMLEYNWDSYNMAFSIPNTFNVLENDSTIFSASDSSINLTIYPISAIGIDSTNMETLLNEWALNNGVEVLSTFEKFDDEDNYSGILCAGRIEPFNVMLLLALDPVFADTGFYIWISYDDKSIDTVMSIVDSFYPI
jgi:hypothetical protein